MGDTASNVQETSQSRKRDLALRDDDSKQEQQDHEQ